MNDNRLILRKKIEERLKDYIGLPNIEIVRDSIYQEILEELEKELL